MDAVKYLKEKKRLCGEAGVCRDCLLNELKATCGMSCHEAINNNPKEAVDIVEKWSKEHPVMTNEMKFEEVFGMGFGDATKDGIVKFLSAEYKAPKGEQNEN